MSGWKTIKLGMLADVKGGKRLPKGEMLTTIPNTHPYIRIRDLGKSKTLELTTEYEYVDDQTQKSIARYIVSEGDILLSIVGTIGLVGIVGRSLEQANQTENCVKITKLKGVDRDFLYYHLTSKQGQYEIRQVTVGAVQPKLPLKNIQDLNIPVPPLPTQKKIAAVLGALDDKIENNRKICKTLEEQAQSIFKSWFVDFDPFGGKRPDGWREVPLSDIADFYGGYSYKGSELRESDCAMATIKNFERCGGFKLDGFKEIIPSAKLKPYQEVDLFDVLVAHTDLTQNADVIGNAEMLLSKSGYAKIIMSMDLVKVVPKLGVSKFVLAALLKNNVFKSHCLRYVNGTTVLHLSKDALRDYSLLFPNDPSSLNDISQLLESIYSKMSVVIEESRTLAELRDALLPKLMSGEIDVEKVVA